MSDAKREPSAEKPHGATRRDLFHIGSLALPALVSAWEADAAPAPGPLKTGPQIYQSIGVSR